MNFFIHFKHFEYVQLAETFVCFLFPILYQLINNLALDLKKGTIYEGQPEGNVKPDTTLSVTDGDLVDIALGKLNPQVAFMKGKLKIAGNIMLTQKLVPLLKTEAKL